jgi:hypothetical protein
MEVATVIMIKGKRAGVGESQGREVWGGDARKKRKERTSIICPVASPISGWSLAKLDGV